MSKHPTATRACGQIEAPATWRLLAERIRVACACVLALVAASVPAVGGSICVDATNVADPAPNGSPEHPFPTIQAGIDAADDGDEVVIRSGVYKGAGNRQLEVRPAITVRSESGPEDCVIDCEGVGLGIDIAGRIFRVVADPVTGILVKTELSRVLNGLTVTNAASSGLHVFDARVTVSRCVIAENTHEDSPGVGGGVNSLDSDLVFTDCRITENSVPTSGWGAGIWCSGGTLDMTDCAVERNQSDGPMGGGGIYCFQVGPVLITRCAIRDNKAQDGGGIVLSQSDVTFTSCTISGNSAKYAAAGLDCSESTVVLTNTVIFGNECDPAIGFASVMSCGDGTTVTIANCTIQGNSAAGEALFSTSDEALTITNSVLWDNGGTQIYGKATVRYSDVQGGWPGTGNIGVDPLFADAEQADGPGGSDEGLRLLPSSPCLNAGDNDAVPPDRADLDHDGDINEPIPLDRAGNPRVFDGTVDMGAFELQGSPGQCVLTVNVQGRGTVTLDPPGGTYDAGTSVQLTATPASGWHFVSWQGDATGTGNPASVLMDASKAVTAVFEQNLAGQYVVTVNVQGQGTVTLDPPGGTYDAGTSVQLTATPASGWHFVSWQGDATGTSNPTTVVMTSDRSVVASFESEAQTAPTGACCFTDGSCTVLTAAACAGQGGTQQGDGTTCEPNACSTSSGRLAPTGVCPAASTALIGLCLAGLLRSRGRRVRDVGNP